MTPIINLEQKKYKYINVTVNIIDNCNYTCNYCYNKDYRSNNILNLTALYNYILKTKLNIALDILGGEPTLHPDLLIFVRRCQNYQIYLK